MTKTGRFTPFYDPKLCETITNAGTEKLLELERKLSRPICEYCRPGMYTGLPGNACENCMNTGYADATIEDMR